MSLARPFPSNSGSTPLCYCTRPHSKRRGSSTPDNMSSFSDVVGSDLMGLNWVLLPGAVDMNDGGIELLFESMFLVALPG